MYYTKYCIVLEAAISRLHAEVVASKEAFEAAASGHKLECAKLREESEGSRAQAEQVDVLMARCARLEVSRDLEHAPWSMYLVLFDRHSVHVQR